MCTDDCSNKGNPNQGIERRSFLSGATAAVVGVTLGSEVLALQRQPPSNALNDPTVIQDFVSFKSGTDMIQGYLARPSKAGQFRAVLVLHGNLHLPEDHRYTAAQLAQAGFIGLAIRRFSERGPSDAGLSRLALS